ncbi:hypothetical protein [Pseudooctadecabacter jejudonensis]|uniref:Uncharacterized protein n=1 Tax=Pseudooctadecabacter jejudonensis TaxID=1391910 RepID=A0A1Y5RKJ4_9RHOB|nr:hypothetical protein [Pseudooctadecabacter jejudonensis]SLN16911.1 hypothetical protein PSJ8397_00476 [Pseudooctadecabacter jejudonensis]
MIGRQGWLIFGWLLILGGVTFSQIEVRTRDRSGFVVDCFAFSNSMVSVALIVIGIVLIQATAVTDKAYLTLGLAACALFAAGFNLGDVLCPDFVLRPPQVDLWPF